MDRTGKQVYMGLAGFYLIGDAQEAALNLPSGAYDVPLVVQDRQFNTDGTLSYPSSISATSSSTVGDGFMGDTLLVNGAPQPYFKVSARKYRLRLLNGSNSRYVSRSFVIPLQVDVPAWLVSRPDADIDMPNYVTWDRAPSQPLPAPSWTARWAAPKQSSPPATASVRSPVSACAWRWSRSKTRCC
jgi:hypothetical protein